jgi:hypothetical protein
MKVTLSRQLGWAIVVVLFTAVLIGLLMFPDQRQAARIQRKMMAMTAAALQEAVVFSHMKYHTRSDNQTSYLDLFELNGQGVDFNSSGFPVGVSHTSDSVKLPITQRDCRELWETLLAPMRPMLAPDHYASFTVRASNGKCVFTSIGFVEYGIVYDPELGRVQLTVVD